jgi:hypothetical protein
MCQNSEVRVKISEVCVKISEVCVKIGEVCVKITEVCVKITEVCVKSLKYVSKSLRYVSKSLKKVRTDVWFDGRNESFIVEFTWNKILVWGMSISTQNPTNMFKTYSFQISPIQKV